jgi:hypothetical protein
VCRFCSVVLAHQIERIAVQNNRLGGTVFCACVITKDVKERQKKGGKKSTKINIAEPITAFNKKKEKNTKTKENKRKKEEKLG